MDSSQTSAQQTCEALLSALAQRADPDNVAGMARYGISTEGTLGVKVADVRTMVRTTLAGRRHEGEWRHQLAECLWGSGVHEARIMAAIVDEPTLASREQAERWVLDLDSWDVCDQLCSNLLRRTTFAWDLACEWPLREETFAKRAGFVIAAQLAVHEKGSPAERFRPLLELVRCEADDDRPMVQKGANWSLRQIGKRGEPLLSEALALAEALAASESRAERRVGRGAVRELRARV